MNVCQYHFPHLKDCHMPSFRQIKMSYFLKSNLEAILPNFIPIIISSHTVLWNNTALVKLACRKQLGNGKAKKEINEIANAGCREPVNNFTSFQSL